LIYPRSTFVIWRTHNHHNYFRFHSLTGVDVSSIREWRVREKSSVVKRLWLPADICRYIRRDFPNTYDALGRVRTVIHGDGSHVNYSYSGRATQVTDENGASRIIQVDGLGRPTVVCEISATSLQGDSPSACSLDITAPQAYITNYAYSTDTSAANALKLIVNQGVQTRTFETDWLGRTTSVTEPESSTTTYSYGYKICGQRFVVKSLTGKPTFRPRLIFEGGESVRQLWHLPPLVS
jgi:hypothetical protein